MESALNVVFWVTLTVCSGAVFVTVSLACINLYRVKTAPTDKDLPRILRSFMSEEANPNRGLNFADLIQICFFVVRKTNNHSKDFDEEKHLQDFRKNLTPANSAALRKIGEIYGQHFV